MVEIYPTLHGVAVSELRAPQLDFSLDNVSRLYATQYAENPIHGGISANLVDQIVNGESAAFRIEKY